MKELLALLGERGIDKAFESLGLFVEALVGKRAEGKADPYADHEWLVKKVPRFGTVINAVPPDSRFEELPWEEWFVLDGTQYHHVLFLNQPPRHDEIFEAPEQDDIHPPRTLGRKWYVVDDSDMSFVLLRPGS